MGSKFIHISNLGFLYGARVNARKPMEHGGSKYVSGEISFENGQPYVNHPRGKFKIYHDCILELGNKMTYTVIGRLPESESNGGKDIRKLQLSLPLD